MSTEVPTTEDETTTSYTTSSTELTTASQTTGKICWRWQFKTNRQHCKSENKTLANVVTRLEAGYRLQNVIYKRTWTFVVK